MIRSPKDGRLLRGGLNQRFPNHIPGSPRSHSGPEWPTRAGVAMPVLRHDRAPFIRTEPFEQESKRGPTLPQSPVAPPYGLVTATTLLRPSWPLPVTATQVKRDVSPGTARPMSVENVSVPPAGTEASVTSLSSLYTSSGL